MKIRFAILFLLFFSNPLFAQPRKFQLIDREKRPLAFMDITINGQFTNIYTDEKGFFTIDLNAYSGTDRVGIITSFYDTEISTVETLKKQKRSVIRIAHKEITLDPVVVSAEVRDPKKLAQLITTLFKERYGTFDYFVNSCCIKTVQSHGAYREFSAAMGVAFFANYSSRLVQFPWDDPSRYFWGFYDRMQSDLFQCGSDEVLEILELTGNNATAFNAKYNSAFMNMNPVETLRAVELYTPMNEKALSFFSYHLDSVFVRENDQIVVLGFKSNPTLFPKKSRLLGEGRVVYNSTQNIVEQIELFNFKQYYSSFVHDRTDLPARHKTHFRISFNNREGKMYIKELYYKRTWDKEPLDDTEKRYYYSSFPARRNPVRNGLEELFYVTCDDTIGFISKSGDSANNLFSPNVVNWLYEAPYTPDRWRSCAALKMFPMSKIEADLGGVASLERQFVTNSNMPYPEDMYHTKFKDVNNSDPGFSKQFPTYQSLTEQCKNNIQWLEQTVLPVLEVKFKE